MANKAYSLAHTKWKCKYHIVFTPKYRRKIIYNQYRKSVGEILRTLCKYKGVDIIEGHLMPDHVYMLVIIPPKSSFNINYNCKSGEFLTKYVANTFKVVIQLGSILAVVVVFKDRFIQMLGLDRYSQKIVVHQKAKRLRLSQVIVGLIPAGVLGVLFEDYIDEYLFTTYTVLIGLVIGAVLMIFADLQGNKKPKIETVDQITYRQAFIIGLIQCFYYGQGFQDLVQLFPVVY